MVGMMVGLAALTSWGLHEFNRRAGRYRLPTTAAERAPYERHLTEAALYVFGRLYLVAAALCVAGAACAWPTLHGFYLGATRAEQDGPTV
jgi:hypothetical protein